MVGPCSHKHVRGPRHPRTFPLLLPVTHSSHEDRGLYIRGLRDFQMFFLNNLPGAPIIQIYSVIKL